MMSKDWTTLWVRPGTETPRWSQLCAEGACPPSPCRTGIPGCWLSGGGQRSGSSTAPGRTVRGLRAGKAASVGAGARLRGGSWPVAAAGVLPGGPGRSCRAICSLHILRAEDQAAPQGDWEAGGQAGPSWIRTRGAGSSEIATCRVRRGFCWGCPGESWASASRLFRASEWGLAGGGDQPSWKMNETSRCNAPGRPFQTVPTPPPRPAPVLPLPSLTFISISWAASSALHVFVYLFIVGLFQKRAGS